MAKTSLSTTLDSRGKRLKGGLKETFNQVILLLASEGVINIKDLYVDGTKIGANANRYTFVWGKDIKNSRERINKQPKAIWRYLETVYAEEGQTPNTPNFDSIGPDKVAATIGQVNQALVGKQVDKKIKQKLNYAKRDWPEDLKKYKGREARMGDRNPMGKTGPDATFMRIKDDHMQNGQPKPGYNIQIPTNTQYIVNYTAAQTTAVTTTLKGHLTEHHGGFNESPDTLTADAGYGSEENHQTLEDNQIEGFVKYNYFHKEQHQAKKGPNPFAPENLHYNPGQDCYYWPMGQPLENIGQYQGQTKTGFTQTIHRYQAKDCQGCPLRGMCHKPQGNRIIERNYKLVRHKQKAKARLLSQQGIAKRKQRCWHVEAVFGNIKQNMNFKRFMLRGLDKINVEMGLIALAHNLKKVSTV